MMRHDVGSSTQKRQPRNSEDCGLLQARSGSYFAFKQAFKQASKQADTVKDGSVN
jgi:hypothetical protein